MSNLSPDDLVYLASILNDIPCHDKAVDYMFQLAEIHPNFNRNERTTFGITIKGAADSLRHNLRTLTEQYENELEANHQIYCNQIKLVIQKVFSELSQLCLNTINLVNKTIISACDTIQSKAFFLKMKGDMYRYLSEFSDFCYENQEQKSEYLQNSHESYKLALHSSKELPNNDPVRLGLLLNYAVLKYEHMHSFDDASNLLHDAINSVNNDFSDLSENSKQESLEIISVMRNNLRNWDYTGEEEEEEEK